MRIVTIDIEVECENGFPNADKALEPMLSITIKNHDTGRIKVWGLHDYQNDREDVQYIKCQTERELCTVPCMVESDHPDIITGWNTERFDIPYICNRIKSVMGEDAMKRLSPWGVVNSRIGESMVMDVKTKCMIFLVLKRLTIFNSIVSLLTLHKNLTVLTISPLLSWGERKDENPYETFRDWYTKDYQSFLDYNIQDVELVDKLDDKMKLIDLILTMTYEAKVNISDSFTSVKYWDVLIYNHLLKKKIVIPQKVGHKNLKNMWVHMSKNHRLDNTSGLCHLT